MAIFSICGRRRQIQRWWKPAVLTVACLFLINNIWSREPGRFFLPENVDVQLFALFEPNVISDFPEGPLNKTVIPRIIHQTWRDRLIPPKFVDNIRSYVKNNPGWDYVLWTDESSRKLIAEHFPSLLPVWDGYVYSYHHRLRQFNVIRYVIMYVYGGVFVDMDTVNFKPMEEAIKNHACILPTEPFENALETHVQYTITNAIMICRPKHPFFKFVLDNIHRYEHLSHSWDSAGPGFLTTQFKLFIEQKHLQNLPRHPTIGVYLYSPYFQVDIPLPENPEDDVYIPNSQYFTGSVNAAMMKGFKTKCQHFHELHALHQQACIHILQKNNTWRKRQSFAFVEHFMQNNWYGLENFYNYLYIYRWIFGKDINQIVPEYKLFL